MKVLIAAGGSGGHVLPALYTARELKNAGCAVSIVSTKGFMSEKIRNEGFDLFLIDAKGVSFCSVGSVCSSAVAMLKAFGQSLSLLKTVRPDAVAGFGGYGAFPVVLTAWLSGRPALIHEQNVMPGRANRILAGIVQKIAISFKESEAYFGKRKTVLTGCPCHVLPKNFSKGKVFEKFRLTEGKFTFLVLGGSQGSRRINQAAPEALSFLRNDLDFQVIHLTGEQDCDAVTKKYRELGIPSRVFSFLDGMEEAYMVSDLVVSRSGAVTVSEIALTGLPAVLIPYPFAGNHQIANARVLCANRKVAIIEEKDLSPETLKDCIAALVQTGRGPQADVFGGVVFPDAANRIAKEIMALTK